MLFGVGQPQRGGAMIRSESSVRSGAAKLSSASSRCSPSRRDAYQTHRRNIDLVAKSSAGVRSGIDVLYVRPPAGTVDGTASGRSCGRAPATRVNIPQTSSGGSSSENNVVTVREWAPGGRLRLVNDAAASTEFGMICRPLPYRYALRAS